MKNCLSANQMVQRMGGAISVKLIYKLIRLGKLSANRVTSKILVEEDSLIELLEDKPRQLPLKEPPPAPKRMVSRSRP